MPRIVLLRGLRLAILGLPFLSGAAAAADAPAPAASAAAAAAAAKAVTLDKVEVVSDRLSGAGNVVLQREEIVRQSGADGDLNKLLQTLPNVQFSDADGRVTMASIIDLRPSLVSISGGRPYDNNFQIDGLSTNSIQDSSNQNIHASNEIVGHHRGSGVREAARSLGQVRRRAGAGIRQQ
jgi:outer membrane receptor protein involved in Fe transport